MKRAVTAEELAVAMMSYRDALALVTSSFASLAPQVVDVAECAGMLLAEDVRSTISVPPLPTSTMDGYAIAAIEEPSTVSTFEKVMTGAPLPDWADAVAPWEVATEVDGRLTVSQCLLPGSFVRAPGVDVRVGDTVLRAGIELDAISMGILASIGLTHVSVFPRPRVAVLSTGDELVVPGSQLSDASVYDSNSSMLPALLRANGAEVVRVDLLPDDRAAITSWLREFAPTVDAIVTSGGASVGERDWMRTILVEDGELHLWRVALKPGKPFAFGSFDSTPVFALPGNPASVLACTHAFVKPALRLMSGGTAHHSGGSMRLTEDLHAPRDRAFLFPVRVEGDNAIPVRAAGSSTLVNHLQAEAYAIVEPGGMKAGDEVTVEFF